MNLSFEPLQKDDIPQIEEIINGFMTYNPERIQAFLSGERNIALVAKYNGKIIGLIYGYSLSRMDGEAPQFFIYSVDIHSDYQDMCYGTQFMKFVVDWAKENGFSESFVITDRDNPRACRVYEKAGMKYSENDCDRIYVIEYNKS